MALYQLTINGKTFQADLLHKCGTSVSFALSGTRYDVDIAPLPISPGTGSVAAPSMPPPAAIPQIKSAKSDAVYAPMPGIIVSVTVKPGDTVEMGQTVLVMEAMKMENNVASPRAGKVKEVLITAGQEVGNHQLLISFQ